MQYDQDLICKLFHPDYPKIYVEHEFNNAKSVFRLGIKTPRAYKMVCIAGRNGILYDRVIGDALSSKIYEANKNEKAVWLNRFVDLHKKLLGHSMDDAMDYKDFLKLFAANSAETIARIDELKDGNCLLHGDFHPGNVMVDANGDLILVDMMNICKGPAAYDIARTYFLLRNHKKLQNEYLEAMGYKLAAIMPYLEVISLLREKEKRG